jgi:hypothetical protein
MMLKLEIDQGFVDQPIIAEFMIAEYELCTAAGHILHLLMPRPLPLEDMRPSKSCSCDTGMARLKEKQARLRQRRRGVQRTTSSSPVPTLSHRCPSPFLAVPTCQDALFQVAFHMT